MNPVPDRSIAAALTTAEKFFQCYSEQSGQVCFDTFSAIAADNVVLDLSVDTGESSIHSLNKGIPSITAHIDAVSKRCLSRAFYYTNTQIEVSDVNAINLSVDFYQFCGLKDGLIRYSYGKCTLTFSDNFPNRVSKIQISENIGEADPQLF